MLGPNDNTGLPEMAIRAEFRDDLLLALQEERPLADVVEAYKQEYPELAATLECDYLFELETGFKTDEEWDAEFVRLEEEEAQRRATMSQSNMGRLQLLLEDIEYEELMEIAMQRLREARTAAMTAPAPLPRPRVPMGARRARRAAVRPGGLAAVVRRSADIRRR